LRKIYQKQSLTVYQSDLYMTNSMVLELPELVVVVDPNWLPREVAAIKKHVYNRLGNRPLYLLFTHSDYDHIIGYRAFPGAKVIASRRFRDKDNKEEILELIRQFDDDYYIVRDYSIDYPNVDIVIDQDGDTLSVGDTTLTFYMAPGHNDDGILTVVQPEGILLAGDYLSDVEFPYIYHSSIDYMQTLKKAEHIMNTCNIQTLVPGHGSVTESYKAMQRLIQVSRDYILGLRSAIEAEDQALIESIIIECPFPRNMRKFHENNRKLMEKEAHSK
jgi:hydroxyacylglutathione hydrolase